MNKLPALTETQEAHILVAYMRIKNLKFMHIPAETGSTPEAWRRAVRMKQQGTSPGFPDYLIIVSNQVIAIELKRTKGSVVSQYQKDWIESLNAAGLPTYIAHGADQAIAVIDKYLTAQVSNGPTF